MTEHAVDSSAPAIAGAEDGGYSDELLADVQLGGAPRLLNFHQLDRRRRAQLARKIAEIAPGIERVEAHVQPGRIQSLATAVAAADVVEFMADVEDLVGSVAVDAAAFTAWATGVSDLELLALFAQWVRTFSAGEASSSSS